MILFNIRKIFIAFFCFAFAVLGSSHAKAQNNNDELYFHRLLYKQTSFDYNSIVASDMIYSNNQEFSDIAIKYSGEYGTYHRPQTAKNQTGYIFDAQGCVIPSEKIYMGGGFHFSQNYKNSVRFNSLIDPYRGTPYQLADSTDSNWRIQNYSMWTKLATEIIDKKLSAGVFLSLNVARGAKMIDPRPKSNNNRIEAVPSLTLNLGKNRIGGAFVYERFNELTNFILYNTSETQKIYAFKGLGQYTFDIFSTTERERRYDGHGIGGMISYRYRENNFEIDIQGKYTNYGEEVSDIENNKPRLRGKYFSDKYFAIVDFKLYGDNFLNQIKIIPDINKESGKEIIQIYNSSENVNAWQTDSEAPNRWKGNKKNFKAVYSLKSLSSDKNYSPYGIEVGYQNKSFDEKYEVMDTYINFKNNIISLSPEMNTLLGNHLLASFKLNGEYCIVTDFNANYKEREEDNPTVKEMFFDKETDILSQNYYSLGGAASIGYSFDNGNSLIMNVDYKYLRTENGFYRHYPLISLSYNF
ncbi:MAG: hypothetical protein Q4F97_03150 [Bacteroidales bacterium]|nr:hypothetical protein [Bacteroidales bacterium]